MSRFYKGMRFRTSYGTGPYVVTGVIENCTCPNIVDTINLGDKAPMSRPHAHLRCKKLDPKDKGDYSLNGYDENMQCVWPRSFTDYLIDLDEIVPAILVLMI